MLHIFLQSGNTTYLYYRKGQVAFKNLMAIVIPAIVSGQVSTLMLSLIGNASWGSSVIWKSHTLPDLILFSVYSLVMGFLIYTGLTEKKFFETKKESPPSKLELVAIGCLAGFLSALLGIGGGFLLVPYLVIRMNFDAPHAAAGSIFMIFSVSLFSSLQYAYHNLILWQVSVITATGSLLGSLWGTKIVQGLERAKFKRYFALLQLFVLIGYSAHFFSAP